MYYYSLQIKMGFKNKKFPDGRKWVITILLRTWVAVVDFRLDINYRRDFPQFIRN
jgi:hypothetical protein